MDSPPGVVFKEELDWVCKEPALVLWTDPKSSEVSSLGLPCPAGKPTQLTLWIGKNSTNAMCIMLHLHISVRFSKRRKVLDYFLLLPSSSISLASIITVDDASSNSRPCLEEVYGKSSTRKCIHVPFQQKEPGRVMMPLSPDNAPGIGGTALHLLILLRSLSSASNFDLYTGHSSYAHHTLTNLVSQCRSDVRLVDIDLTGSYGEKGGVFDDWKDEQKSHKPALLPSGVIETCGSSKSGSNSQMVAGASLIEKVSSEQQAASPPPYSPPRPFAALPATPKLLCVSKLRLKPRSDKRVLNTLSDCKDVLNVSKRVRLSDNSERSPKYAGSSQSPQPQLEASPTIANTPSTVENSSAHRPEHLSPARDLVTEYHHVSGQELTRGRGSFGNSQEPDILLHSSFSCQDSSETPSIKPTVFVRESRERLNKPSPNRDSRFSRHQKQSTDRPAGTMVSPTKASDHGHILDELLYTLDYHLKSAELGLQETSDDLKTELQLERDKGIEEITDHADVTLNDVKSQMEDLASAHLVDIEERLQKTSEKLREGLGMFFELQKHNRPASESPSVAATKVFLREFGHLDAAAKVKVLERLASHGTAEVFCTVDERLREAWVDSWTLVENNLS